MSFAPQSPQSSYRSQPPQSSQLRQFSQYLASAGSLWRHVLAGALSVVAAVLAMATTAWVALAVLGAGTVAPVSRLVPALVSMAVRGGVSVESAASTSGGGLLGGLRGGGLSVGLAGDVAVTPLTLTFVGTVVLGVVFFRPLHRSSGTAPVTLWARCGGASVAAAVVFPILAAFAHGTARLPENVTQRFREGASGGAFSRFSGGGGGSAAQLSSVSFATDGVATGFLGLLWVSVVLGVGCVVARRTTLPYPHTLGRLRLKWNAVTSTLTGIAAVLCCAAVAVALLAGAAALTGREQAAKAAGLLLLVGPNLIAVLLTSGLGTSWEAGVHRLRPSGGVFGMFGSGGQGGTTGADRSVNLGDWAGAGIPLWVIGLLLVLLLLVSAGFVVAARTPVRTPKEDSDSLLDRHAEIGVRLGIAVGVLVLVLPLLARGSLRIGISLMGVEVGGLTAGLDGSPGLPALAGSVLATLAGYGGSRLWSRWVRRRGRAARLPGAEPRPPARSSSSQVPSDSAL
ncbi:streptophobe family protein [Streptomyces sp. NPDC052051]|uniref:streptophobe family protein n=1 Tax=Streptomyces sp. NPDC052051 TaxID=3154649 RepID=UPI0034163EC7